MLPTTGALWVELPAGIIVGRLTYLPALALALVVERVVMPHGLLWPAPGGTPGTSGILLAPSCGTSGKLPDKGGWGSIL
jgi:hypothetical protein